MREKGQWRCNVQSIQAINFMRMDMILKENEKISLSLWKHSYMKKIAFVLFLAFIYCSANSQTGQSRTVPIAPDPKEYTVMDTIAKLPEVVAYTSLSKDPNSVAPKLSMYVFKRPDNENKYYWVKIIKSDNVTRSPLYDFFVYLSDETPTAKVTLVKHYDESTKTASELSVWRSQMENK